MQFLDANIFLRYLTRDDPAKAQACYTLFQQLKSGASEATTTEVVIAEVCYVLSARSQYGLPPAEISGRLKPLLAVTGLKLSGKRRLLRGLDLYAAYPFLDFEDALTVASMEKLGITEMFSYDTDFDRIPWIRRREP